MAKTLDYLDTSAQTTKLGDTSTVIALQLNVDGGAYDLTGVSTVEVVIGTADSKRLGSVTVDTTTITDPETGQITVPIDATFMKGLKAGTVYLEVHVTTATNVAVFPTTSTLQFTIYQDIE